MSYDKYRAAQRVAESPRQAEYRIFGQVTNQLMSARDSGSKKEIIRAVAWNRRFWLALQADLAMEDNKLPNQLRAQLISLSIWVDKHSGKVIRGHAEMEPLIDVNKTIMAGLSTQPAAKPGPQPAAATGSAV